MAVNVLHLLQWGFYGQAHVFSSHRLGKDCWQCHFMPNDCERAPFLFEKLLAECSIVLSQIRPVGELTGWKGTIHARFSQTESWVPQVIVHCSDQSVWRWIREHQLLMWSWGSNKGKCLFSLGGPDLNLFSSVSWCCCWQSSYIFSPLNSVSPCSFCQTLAFGLIDFSVIFKTLPISFHFKYLSIYAASFLAVLLHQCQTTTETKKEFKSSLAEVAPYLPTGQVTCRWPLASRALKGNTFSSQSYFRSRPQVIISHIYYYN